MFVLISLFGLFAVAWRSQTLRPCSPWVHEWPFYFGTHENCDGSSEDDFILWVLGIGYLIMAMIELRVWRGLAHDDGRREGKLEILGNLAKLDGKKRLEAVEKLLNDYGSFMKVAEEDKDLLIDFGVVGKVAEEDLEKDLEKGILLIEL